MKAEVDSAVIRSVAIKWPVGMFLYVFCFMLRRTFVTCIFFFLVTYFLLIRIVYTLHSYCLRISRHRAVSLMVIASAGVRDFFTHSLSFRAADSYLRREQAGM